VTRCIGDPGCPRDPGEGQHACWFHRIDPAQAAKPTPAGRQLSEPPPILPKAGNPWGALPSWTSLWGDTSQPC
jgi:hypothetical protein